MFNDNLNTKWAVLPASNKVAAMTEDASIRHWTILLHRCFLCDVESLWLYLNICDWDGKHIVSTVANSRGICVPVQFNPASASILSWWLSSSSHCPFTLHHSMYYMLKLQWSCYDRVIYWDWEKKTAFIVIQYIHCHF